MKILINLSIAFLLIGCGYNGGFDKGDCVYISHYSTIPVGPTKAKWITYEKWAYWFEVNGEIQSISAYETSVIPCEQ